MSALYTSYDVVVLIHVRLVGAVARRLDQGRAAGANAALVGGGLVPRVGAAHGVEHRLDEPIVVIKRELSYSRFFFHGAAAVPEVAHTHTRITNK